MFALVPISLLAIAGRALSFNITLGSEILQSNDILNLDFSVAPLNICSTNCTTAQQTINTCGTDGSCFCSSATVSSLLNCEQCMFTALINANQRMPDPRAGSTPVLTAYTASCSAINITLTAAQTTLIIPPNWDGPEGIFIPTGGLVVAVGTAFLLGVSSILILSNM